MAAEVTPIAERGLARVSSAVEKEVRDPLQGVIDAVLGLLGHGDPEDAAITFKDAKRRGLVDTLGRALTGDVTYVNQFPTVGGAPPTGPDLTPPPDVAGLNAVAGFTQVIVTFNTPTYTQGRGNLRTRIYAVKKAPSDPTLPTFDANTTPEVGSAVGASPILAIPSEPNTRWHIWARHETMEGVPSVNASGGINGRTVTTGQDISQLLAILSGQITESQLFSTLQARINLIDGPDTLPGSVAARVKTEETTRIAQDSALASRITSLRAASRGFVTDDTDFQAATEFWELYAGQAWTVTSGSQTGRNALRGSGPTHTWVWSKNSYPIDTTKQYRVRGRFRRDSAAPVSRRIYLAAVLLDQAGIPIEQDGSWWFYAANNLTPSTNWTDYEALFGASTGRTFPSNARSMRAGAILYYDTGGAQTGGWHEVEALRIEDADATRLDAAVQVEQNARVDGDAANAQTITTVQAIVRAKALGLPFNAWTLNGHSLVTISDGKVGAQTLRLVALPSGYPAQGNYVALDTTKTYRTRFWARPSASANGFLYFSLRQFLDTAGTPGPNNGGRSPYKPNSVSRAAHESEFGSGAWGEYSFLWSAADWQAGVKFVVPEFLDNYTGSTGHWDIQDFTFEEVTRVENAFAAISQESSARASLDGSVQALYTVRAEVSQDGRTVTGGFGLAGTATAAQGPRIDFGVVANRFWVAAPAGTTGVGDVQPFVIQTGEETINGVVIPRGVYMDAAYIKNLSALVARLGSVWIDNAMIANCSVAKLLGGVMQVGAYIESTNYTSGPGGAGFRINADGTAELQAAFIRGQLVAGQINARGLSILDGSGNVLLNAGASQGWSALTGKPSDAQLLNSNQQWSDISGPGTPEANATRGAPAGTNVGGTSATTVEANAAAGASANAAVNNATTGLDQRLRANAQNILAGPGGLASGTIAWDSAGNVTGGVGIGITAKGIVARNAGGTTFTLNGEDGTATYAGSLAAATGSFVGETSVGGRTWASGNGFWAGLDGGVAKFVAGNSLQYISWTGSVLEIKLDTITLSASPTTINVNVSNGDGKGYGSITVTPSGGTAPYTYSWTLTDTSVGGGRCYISGGSNTATCGFAGDGVDTVNVGIARCFVTDANNRFATITVSIVAEHGVPV